MGLSAGDRLELQDLLGRYCHLMDDGDAAWAELFTEDGVLDGVLPKPAIGCEALRQVPAGAMAHTGGFFRHLLGSILINETGPDEAAIFAYNLVTDWRQGGKLVMFARYQMQAARTPGGWRLKHVHARVDQ